MKCPLCGYKMKYAGDLDSKTGLYICLTKDCECDEMIVSKSFKPPLEFALVHGKTRNGEEREGFYINGCLILEGNRVSAKEIVRLFSRNGYNAEVFEIKDVEFWDKNQTLPKTLAEIPNGLLI